MMSEHNFIDWRIITGKLKGRLSEKEEREFQQWFEASTKHRAYFKRLQDQWEQENNEIDVNVETYIRDFDRHASQRTPQRSIPAYHRWIWVAAAVIPLAIAAWILLFTDLQTPRADIPAIVKLAPGESKAKLTLADGRIIFLDKHITDTIENDGILLQQDSGILAYRDINRKQQTSVGTNTLEVPRGGEYILEMSDGTKVWLNSGTRLTYPACFIGNERRVELDGEAYFHVKQNPHVPFIVKTRNSSIKVYGTSFNVCAYTEDKNVVTTLQEGSVGIFVQGQEYRLHPGEQAIVERSTDNVNVKKVNVDAYCSWYKGTFIFEEESLDEILTRLSRWYNLNIFYQNPSIKKLHFTGDLGRYEDFNEVLKLIELTTNVKFVVQNRNITVKYK